MSCRLTTLRLTGQVLLLLFLLTSCSTYDQNTMLFTQSLANDPALQSAPRPEVREGEVIIPEREPVDPEMVGVKVAATFREQLNTLRKLHWKSRTRLQIEGAPVLEVLHAMRLDVNGDVHRSLRQTRSRSDSRPVLVAEAADPERLRQTEIFADLAHAYTHTLSGKIVHSIENATWTPAEEPYGAWLCQLNDLLMPGDAVHIVAWPSGGLESITFLARPNDMPCRGVVSYRELPDGTAYPATTHIEALDQPLQATVECFEYRVY